MITLEALAAEALEQAKTVAHSDRRAALERVAEICRDPEVEVEADAVEMFDEERENARGNFPKVSVFAWAPLRLMQLWHQARPLAGARKI